MGWRKDRPGPDIPLCAKCGTHVKRITRTDDPIRRTVVVSVECHGERHTLEFTEADYWIWDRGARARSLMPPRTVTPPHQDKPVSPDNRVRVSIRKRQ
jgi:hypothetical protein